MNKNLKYYKDFIIFIIIVYLMFSFVEAKIDFRKWSEEYRFYFALYGIILGALISLFHYIDDNWKLN